MMFMAIITAAASLIAGRPVNVACQPLTAGGEFRMETNTIVLGLPACNGIKRFMVRQIDFYSVWAVLGLAHESEHASLVGDWWNETLTECRALAAMPRLADLLGGDSAKTERLALKAHAYVRSFPGYADHAC